MDEGNDYLVLVATVILIVAVIVLIVMVLMHDDVKDMKRTVEDINNHPDYWLEKRYSQLRPGETMEVASADFSEGNSRRNAPQESPREADGGKDANPLFSPGIRPRE